MQRADFVETGNKWILWAGKENKVYFILVSFPFKLSYDYFLVEELCILGYNQMFGSLSSSESGVQCIS